MASYNQYGIHTHDDGINPKSATRVYINPNFQRNNTVIPQNGSFYVNPQFHHPNFSPTNVSKPKIYVNPNFVRTSSSIPSVSNHNHYSVSDDKTKTSSTLNVVSSYCAIPSVSISNVRTNPHMSSYSASPANIYVNSGNSSMISTSTLHLSNVTPNILPQSTKQTVAVPVAKSRYSLVRQNNAVKKLQTQNMDNVVMKMKISKYKTISIDHAKNLQTEKDKSMFKTIPQASTQVTAENTNKNIRSEFIQSRFKLIKKTTTSTKLEMRTPTKRKHSLNNSSKLLPKSNQKQRIRAGMTKFKKNNIPCPLFKKYGTCLRNSRGKCEYLHDKKHVSICRRFLKGICHDKCLLSHEMTAEKMPTCSFYLKGMCTKEDCPYLHVKLNEKSKVCLDFLKGYCEKGDKCLNRHVDICPDQATKGICSRKLCPYPHRPIKKLAVNKAKKLNQSIKLKTNKKIDIIEIEGNCSNQISHHEVENDKGKDCRYYKEVVEDACTVEVEVIKPTRCKLGALPSFIQL